MSKIENQQQNVSELLKLIKENPNLEIIPMVDSEIVCDDCHSWWRGSWGTAEIDEYYVSDERIYLKSFDFDEVVEDEYDGLTDEECAGLDDKQIEKLAEQKANNLPWVKAIVVNITT